MMQRRILLPLDNPGDPDEQGLVHRSETSSAFSTFFAGNYHQIVRIAYSVIRDANEAEDVAQDVFVSAHRRFPHGGSDAAAWARVAAVHTALNAVRSRTRRRRREQVATEHVTVMSPEEQTIARESRDEVVDALARLPRRTAMILVLRYSGCSYAAVAEATGVKVQHVGTMLRRAEVALLKEVQRAARR